MKRTVYRKWMDEDPDELGIKYHNFVRISPDGSVLRIKFYDFEKGTLCNIQTLKHPIPYNINNWMNQVFCRKETFENARKRAINLLK